MNIRDIMAQVIAEQERRAREQVDTAGRSPIPGVTGPAGSGAGIPGMPAPLVPQPTQGPTLRQFNPTGPYSQQALNMAGLLGGQTPGAGPTTQQQLGLLGGPKAPQQPFYVPPGKDVGGMLGGPMRGFRIPGGMGSY